MISPELSEKREARGRAGTQALSLLAAPFNAAVVTVLANGPRPLTELRRETGSPPPTTMRGHLRALASAGIVEKSRHKEFPGTVDYKLAEGGEELLAVARVLADWLATSPEGPTEFGGNAAKNAVRALVEGWSTSIVRALATQPLTLTELDGVISGLSYPSLERRLGAMRAVRQIEPLPSGGRGTPYEVTEWLRRAVAPLAAGVRWEHGRLQAHAAEVGSRDIQAAFLLTLPLLRLPQEMAGSCRLALRLPDGNAAGVIALARDGTAASCGTRLDARTDAWAVGDVAAWLAAVIEADLTRLELGGRSALAANLVSGLHGALFGAVAKSSDTAVSL